MAVVTKLSEVIAILQALDPELPVRQFIVSQDQRPQVEQVWRNAIAAQYVEATPQRFTFELQVLHVLQFERDLRGAL